MVQNRLLNTSIYANFQCKLFILVHPVQVFGAAMRYVKKQMPTMREIQALPPGRLYLGYGLVLIVTPTSRRWAYRYTSPITHRVTETAIGPWPEYGYSSARQVAAQLQVMVLKDEDPVQVARQQRASRTTFEQACDSWIETQKLSSKGQMRNVELFLKKHGKPLATNSVAHIDTNMVEDAIRPIWNKAPKQAKRTARMWFRVFAYAKYKKYCPDDKPNPAAWDGNLSFAFPESKDTNRNHHAAMPYQQVPKFIRELRQHQNRSTTAVALEFCVLNASRSGEVRGMRWSEVEDQVWTVPAERMRARKEHRVPLSDRAMELLTRQKEYSNGSPFVFTGYNGTSLDDTSMRKFLRVWVCHSLSMDSEQALEIGRLSRQTSISTPLKCA
jgi:integrase